MKAILVNDTGGTSNPGCRLVRKGFEILFSEKIEHVVMHDCVPVHYWTDYFRQIGSSGRESIIVKKGYFPTYTEGINEIDVSQWEAIRSRLIANDSDLFSKINSSDCVIVNAEGSMHHNTGSALAVLALTKVGVELGKKVLLLNATVMCMANPILIDVLRNCEFIHVRDWASYKYLKSLGLKSHVFPDIALLGLDVDDTGKSSEIMQISPDSVLITAGVAIRKETLEFLIDEVRSCSMTPIYFSIGDGGETNLAVEVCGQRGVKIIHAQNIDLKQMDSLLKQFRFAISGRHHMNIFFMKVGLPFLPITTNTWKIKECMSLLEYPIKPVISFDEFSSVIKELFSNREYFSTAAKNSYYVGIKKMDLLINELEKCI